MRVEWTTYASPIGPLTLVEGETGPLVVEFPGRAGDVRWAMRFQGAAPDVEWLESPCAATAAWLDAYFDGRPPPVPAPDYLRHRLDVSPAQMAVFKALRKIPVGETRSYGDLARATGQVPRQIGQLVGSNHLAIIIPCHRVVGQDGTLVGYGGGLERKRWLLDHELRCAGVVLR
jgi:O-6-methylguanine DNA methyltransferase